MYSFVRFVIMVVLPCSQYVFSLFYVGYIILTEDSVNHLPHQDSCLQATFSRYNGQSSANLVSDLQLLALKTSQEFKHNIQIIYYNNVVLSRYLFYQRPKAKWRFASLYSQTSESSSCFKLPGKTCSICFSCRIKVVHIVPT